MVSSDVQSSPVRSSVISELKVHQKTISFDISAGGWHWVGKGILAISYFPVILELKPIYDKHPNRDRSETAALCRENSMSGSS